MNSTSFDKISKSKSFGSTFPSKIIITNYSEAKKENRKMMLFDKWRPRDDRGSLTGRIFGAQNCALICERSKSDEYYFANWNWLLKPWSKEGPPRSTPLPCSEIFERHHIREVFQKIRIIRSSYKCFNFSHRTFKMLNVLSYEEAKLSTNHFPT